VRVAVVVVNYQSYPELCECLSALTADTGACAEIVVIDHESDAAAADAVAAAFPAVRLVRLPDNHGFAAGVNRGARESRPPYLLLVNPDSIVEAGLCSTLAGWMDAHPDVGAAGPRINNADGSRQASARRFPNLTTAIAGRSSWLTRVLPRNPLSRWNLPALDWNQETPSDVDWVSGACMMIRRTAFEAVGGMDEGFFLYWEDADFCRRLKAAGFRTVYFPGVSVTHTGGRSSCHAADASLVAFHHSAFRLFWKHATMPARLLAPIVYTLLRVRLAVIRQIGRAKQPS